MTATFTTAEVADQLRCSPRKVQKEATRLGIGVSLGGRAGFRFTTTDVDRLLDALRLAQPVVPVRRRRRSA